MHWQLASTPRAQLGSALQTHWQAPEGSATKGARQVGRDGQEHLQPAPGVDPEGQGGQMPSSTSILMLLKMQG